MRRARRSGPSSTVGGRAEPLQRRDVYGLGALVALLGVVGDLRPLLQRAVTLAVDPGVMDEQVLVAVVRGDEAKPLVVAEPLNGAGGHSYAPPRYVRAATRRMLLKASTCALALHFPALSRPDTTKVAGRRAAMLSRCCPIRGMVPGRRRRLVLGCRRR